MKDESRVCDLVEQVLNDQLTPEEACAHDPQLLLEVKARLDVCRNLELMLEDVFPSDTSSTTPLRIGVVNDRLPAIPGYDMLGVLGRGGIGIIYRVRQLKLNRVVALKMLLSGEFAGVVEIGRFMREARAVAALKHPNIVQIYDVGEVEGRPYFTMELVEGGSLAQKIAGAPASQSPRQAAELVATLARGVHIAHQAGIVHRDLKPGNILLNLDGIPKISDFGLATRFAGECSLTGTDSRLGTPSYMSPEQATGANLSNSPAVDVYALGAILYELLTGQPPFRARTALETQRKIVSEETTRPSRINAKIPRDLETICLKCLHKLPASRYTTAAALADDLDHFLRFEPITARPAGLVERTAKWFRRRPAIAIAVAFGVMLVVLGVSLTLWAESQKARIASDVEADLREVASMEGAGRWSNADVALRRAQSRLDLHSSTSLRQRVNDARRNLTVAARLDAVRLSRASARGLAYYQRRADADYETIFQDALNVAVGSDVQNATAIVNASPIRTALLAALDDWACTASDANRRRWVLNVARGSDPEGWSDRIRDTAKWADSKTVLDLAAVVPANDISVSTLLIIAERLRQAKQDPTPFLRKVQKDHPADFYANLALGDATTPSDNRKAEVCYRAALAARPEEAIGYSAVADSLREQRQFEEALYYYSQALKRDPDCARAKCDIGATYLETGRFNDAAAACYESLKLDPHYAWTHYHLAGALAALGRIDEATPHYAAIIEHVPDARGVLEAYRAALVRAGKTDQVLESWNSSLQDRTAGYDRFRGYAEFCLFAGKESEYRVARATLIDRFGSTTSPAIMQQIALIGLLLPASQDSAAEVQRACAWADQALAARGPTTGDYARFVFVKALADYRRGKLDDTIKQARGDGMRIMGPCPRLLAAMAIKDQGHDAEAVRALADAVVKFDWRPGSADSPDLWIYHVIVREALSRIVPDLASLIDGSRRPVDNDERAILMAACQLAGSHRLCTQTFVDALAIQPDFIQIRRPNPRFVAACASSALAVCRENGNLQDAIESGADTLRARACHWLNTVLDDQVRRPPLTESGRIWLSSEFATWQRDPGLADLRGSGQSGEELKGDCTELWKSLDRGMARLQQVSKPSTRRS